MRKMKNNKDKDNENMHEESNAMSNGRTTEKMKSMKKSTNFSIVYF